MKLVSTFSVAALLAASLVAQAATVTGDVVNKTTNKPDAGDNVVLIALAQGMQEAARTTTDARGHFSIELPDNNMHLIRVDHQKAAYFEPLPPGTTHVNITVYDVAAKLAGVSTEADVMRVEAGPQGLHVIQNYFVKNASNPPRTQFSIAAYQIYLPPDAKIEASAAMGPQGMPVSSSPMPQADKGHYAFVFPIRPGETRFQLSYTLPYNGSYKFAPRVALPTANLAVMLPKSMSFQGGAPFQAADVEDNVQTYLAKNVQPSQPLAFTVSGTGAMPRDSGQNDSRQNDSGQGGSAQPGASAPGDNGGGGQAASASSDDRPGGGLGNPIDTPDPLQKYKGFILTGLVVLLAIVAAFFLRAKPAEMVAAGPPMPSPLVPTPMPSPANNSGSLLGALKDELFALETERLEGKLSEPEYAEQKAALEQVLRRALARRDS
ncbi:MAG: carboxypeptidase regulatory-like domain-containing protein [Silvibacterium sp.]